MDPHRTVTDELLYLNLIFDPLVGTNRTDTEVSKETGLAREWTVSDDGLVYTFQLREGVMFHDGVEVTAEDVKFSLDRLFEPDTRPATSGVLTSTIESVTVLGPYEVEIRLNVPFLGLLSHLARDGAGLILPRHHAEAVGDTGLAENPIGSGPYKLAARQVGASVELERADGTHFAVPEPPYQRITMRVVPEESTRVAMLTTGDADFIDIGIDSAPALQQAGARILQHSLKDPKLITFPGSLQDDSPLRDANVRAALSHAINREEINQSLWNGVGELTQSPFPGQIGGRPRPPDAYDPELAMQLLAETPYGEGGETLRLQFYASQQAGQARMLEMALAVQDYWRAIGVETDVIFGDFAIQRQMFVDRAYPANAVNISSSSGRSDWSGNSVVYNCEGLISRLCDPTLDEMWAEWEAAADQPSYEASAGAIDEYMMDNRYALVLLAASPLFATTNDQVFDEDHLGSQHLRINARGLLH